MASQIFCTRREKLFELRPSDTWSGNILWPPELLQRRILRVICKDYGGACGKRCPTNEPSEGPCGQHAARIHPRPCHPERSVAESRDLLFSPPWPLGKRISDRLENNISSASSYQDHVGPRASRPCRMVSRARTTHHRGDTRLEAGEKLSPLTTPLRPPRLCVCGCFLAGRVSLSPCSSLGPHLHNARR
jgi:hypothetical protein